VKRVAVCLFAFGAATAAWAGPRIEFKETVFDFGVLPQGATVQRAVPFENTGDAPLEILSVQTSCGCTAALPAEKTVAPGRKSEIRLGYDSRGKVGEVTKIVTVLTTDPARPQVELTVQGLVAASGHPMLTGTQNLFEGSCRACHADRGLGKKGRDLFAADCALCHEHHKMGGVFIAPAAEDMARLSPRALRKTIAGGRPGTGMPAYLAKRGGPLSKRDIASLVTYLKSLH
jgi:mono/diheme cytochrome c family protein